MPTQHTDWHHAPVHNFTPNTTYMVTAGTIHKQHLYRGPKRLALLQEALLSIAQQRGWTLQAWAVFSNHYQFIGQAPSQGGGIRRLIQHVHSDAARKLNEADGTPGRKVWYQYWDKSISFEKSYYPRLHYVIKNAVHHGLVARAEQYPFCSAAQFVRDASAAFRKKVESFGFDRLKEPDDWEPAGLGEG